ncbi:MAG TPA: hypothetical protein VNF07_11010 [Acidimicrobiales bacterium]|nr:hypothetical protein [Acidimicrobiales bacterium]
MPVDSSALTSAVAQADAAANIASGAAGVGAEDPRAASAIQMLGEAVRAMGEAVKTLAAAVSAV